MELQENKVKDEIDYPIVKVDEIEYCKIAVNYTADPEVIKQKETEAVAQLRKVQIPGFRAGKAPDYAIRARCQKQIDNWIARDMSAQAYDDMVFETGLKPIGLPQFKSIKSHKGKYSCEMVVEHKPSFELQDYLSIELSKSTQKSIEEQVANGIIAMRQRAGEVRPYEENDVVERGDEITFSFEATIDGEPFDGSTVEGDLYTVGSNKFPTFDDYIIGMKADEKREFSLVFPEEVPDIGGKTADFKVTVHMGTKKDLAELTEEFFKTCGVKDFDELNVQLTQIISVQAKQAELQDLRIQLTNKLVEIHDFKVPEFQKDREAQFQASSRGLKWKTISDANKELLSKMAVNSVKLSFILDAIRDEEPDSVLTESEAQSQLLTRISQQGQDPLKFLTEARHNDTLISYITALRDEFTLQWIIDQLKENEDNGKTEAEVVEVNKS